MKQKLLSPLVVKRRIKKAILVFNKAEKAYIDAISDARNRCPHNWVFESDPSGNNDSGYSCSICNSTCRRIT